MPEDDHLKRRGRKIGLGWVCAAVVDSKAMASFTRAMMGRCILIGGLFLFAAGCGTSRDEAASNSDVASLAVVARAKVLVTADDALPALLSQVGVFKGLSTLEVVSGLKAYDVNVPFWSDRAEKRRWIGLPAGTRIGFSPTGEWRFPPGTVLVKHFEWPEEKGTAGQAIRLETRVLICDERGGVRGACYKWRADGSDADLVTEPVIEKISGAEGRSWYFPGQADCQTCHAKVSGGVLGVNARQLNRSVAGGGENQLRAWDRLGLFEPGISEESLAHVARLPPAGDFSKSVEERARSFLDVNCGYCHRPGGVAGNFDARYETPLARQNLIGGPVLIDLGVDHARVFSPRDPWRSIALVRVETSDQTKMPPLAHQTVDRASAGLLRKWIESLNGPDVLEPPSISPAGGEFKKSVRVVLRHANPGATIRYTLDGSAPGKSSNVYEKPLDLTEPVTLRARAYKDGMTRSVTVQQTFIVNE